MSRTLDMFKFPPEWNSEPRFDSPSMGSLSYRCGYSRCSQYVMAGSDVILCTCHKWCQVHCSVTRDARTTYTPPTWRYIVAPYLNVAVVDMWTEKVMADCARKLNSFDEKDGSGILHHLLLLYNDVDLLRSLLELGVDAEARFVPVKGAQKLTWCSLAAGRESLAGASAIHCAAISGRGEYLEALIDAGVNLGAKTMDGKLAIDLCKDNVTRKILEEASAPGARRSLAQLAQEGKMFAIKYRMRSGRIAPEDLAVICQGRTMTQWCHSLIHGNYIVNEAAGRSFNHAMVALQVMFEYRYRYSKSSFLADGIVPHFTEFHHEPLPDDGTPEENEGETDGVQKKLDMIIEMMSTGFQRGDASTENCDPSLPNGNEQSGAPSTKQLTQANCILPANSESKPLVVSSMSGTAIRKTAVAHSKKKVATITANDAEAKRGVTTDEVMGRLNVMANDFRQSLFSSIPKQ